MSKSGEKRDSLIHEEKGATTERSSSTRYDSDGEAELPPPPNLTEAEEKRLYRKIDARLMPILALLYPQLVGARICLGVAEAGLFPGVVY
ncbi:hypothetical protein H0H81_006636 [Sphagnurus paluster]|uniref:Uncharacterized protein n=1 Tax=Sphagnurus paluster TaxID=117069 RepID=A0A9P7FV40_9AGAR|nr:hypothetical protein H0H81_006636 [Sphagnurus paluster]